MGACATKPGDLKVKGEPPLVVEDAPAPVVASEEKAKADGVAPAATVAAEADPADAGRRRSLSDLLKQEAETSDGEAEKAVVAEPATSAAVEAGATLGAEAPVQDLVATEQAQAGAGDQVKDDTNGDVQAVVEEEEKRVDPDSVQVAASADDADAAAAPSAPSGDESNVADDASA